MTGTTLTPRRRIRITEVIYCLAVWLQRTDWGTALFWCRYHGSSRLLVYIRYKRQVRRLRWVSQQQTILIFYRNAHNAREGNVFTGVCLPTGEGWDTSCSGPAWGVGCLSQVTLLPLPTRSDLGVGEREGRYHSQVALSPPHPLSRIRRGQGVYYLVMLIGGYLVVNFCQGINIPVQDVLLSFLGKYWESNLDIYFLNLS